VPSFLQDEEADVSYSQSMLQQQSATLTSNDAVINQREREITDIAKGIIELADIFKELQTMVIDQGTMLDRIDYNIENMAVHVKAAEEELVQVCFVLSSTMLPNNYIYGVNMRLKASRTQKNTTKRKIILLLILIIFGVIILLIIKPRDHRTPPISPLPDTPIHRPPPEEPPVSERPENPFGRMRGVQRREA